MFVRDAFYQRMDREDPEEEWRHRSTHSLDSALERGGWSTPRPGRFTSRKDTRYPSYRKLCGTQGRSGWVRKISLPPGFGPQTVQPVASHYTD